MNEELITEILEKLKSGDLSEHLVLKENFLSFRKILVQREDFKHFRGAADRGGNILYQYTESARS
ncbi:hypothetical protein [Bacillus sp. 03113]|uniref:hypothetical protein n=1 Tax=Bacillus sp. 03113 TaxID=2578211 RepID=UPI0011430208|nr:hypothetical protein [Bacillus sp. 03113]